MEKQKLPNSTAALVLGIISIVFACCCSFFGSIFGIIGLILANKAIATDNLNPDVYDGVKNAKTGKILSIVGIALGVIMTIVSYLYIMALGGWDAYMQEIQNAMETGGY